MEPHVSDRRSSQSRLVQVNTTSIPGMLTLLVPFADFDDAGHCVAFSPILCCVCSERDHSHMRTWFTERRPAIPPPITMMMTLLSNTKLKSSGDIFCAESQPLVFACERDKDAECNARRVAAAPGWTEEEDDGCNKY